MDKSLSSNLSSLSLTQEEIEQVAAKLPKTAALNGFLSGVICSGPAVVSKPWLENTGSYFISCGLTPPSREMLIESYKILSQKILVGEGGFGLLEFAGKLTPFQCGDYLNKWYAALMAGLVQHSDIPFQEDAQFKANFVHFQQLATVDIDTTHTDALKETAVRQISHTIEMILSKMCLYHHQGSQNIQH